MVSILEPYMTQIVNRYNDGESTVSICKDFSVVANAVNIFLRKKGVSIRSSSAATRTYTVIENYFDIIDTKEKAYILGLLYADGCNYVNVAHKTSRISIDLDKKDEYLLKKIAQEVGYSGPIRSMKNLACLRISNKYMSAALISIGVFPKKSLELRFPTELIVAPQLMRHFVRGYFDGDGCIYKDGKNYEISIVSTMEFCQKYCELLKRELDIQPYLRETGRKNGITYTAKFRGNRQVARFKQFLYEGCGDLYMERKRLKFDS
jgi:intein/homing endonuclease